MNPSYTPFRACPEFTSGVGVYYLYFSKQIISFITVFKPSALPNQNPEQLARDEIDKQLKACGWIIQSKHQINLNAGVGVAVREYQTDIGPADYVLFVDKKPAGIIEAKRSEEGVRLTTHEDQTEGYATAKLKYLNNQPLFFGYESTGDITRFTDYRDTKPRSRPLFTFPRPETFAEWLKQDKSLRTRLHDIPSLPTNQTILTEPFSHKMITVSPILIEVINDL